VGVVEVRNGCGYVVTTMSVEDPMEYWRYRPVASAVGSPREKIRIEPIESPVPKEAPAPVETPSEVPEKVPA